MTTFSGFYTLKKKSYKKAVNGFLPSIVLVPLKQEKDCECSCLVKAGDVVSEGQLIAVPPAELKNKLKTNIYSPIPGTVSGIEICTSPDGRYEKAVKIKLGGSFSFLGRNKKENDWMKESPASLTRKIAENGTVNTFITPEPVSLAEQIDATHVNKTKLLIVRLFDEDPSRITDSLLTSLYKNEIIEGANITARALDADGILFITEKDFIAPDASKKHHVPVLFMNADSRFYPCSLKKEICSTVRKNTKEAPFVNISAADVFTDASTVLEIYRTVKYGMPVIDRFVHVSGECIPASGLIKVCIGTTLRSLAEQCGGFIKQPASIIINGLITGVSAVSLDSPVTKYVKSVQFLPANRSPDQRQSDCIRCGNCRRNCPRGLSPDILYSHICGGRRAAAEYVESAALCSNCGLCNSVCPARLPISQVIAEFKIRNGGLNVSEE